MQTYNYLIKSDDFSGLFDKEYAEIIKSDSVLIQVFSGEQKERFGAILIFLATKFKNAKLIASSTDGEIFEGKVSILQTVVSISTFNATQLKHAYFHTNSSFDDGVALAKKLVTPRTKLLIAFADGLLCNGEEFLNGIYSIAPEVKVAGGLSGDNAKFDNCYVGLQEKVYDKGSVGVAFDSDLLHVESFYNFGWNKVGRKHIITKSDKNRVYTIDNITAVAFYQKYLGVEITNELPTTGIEFPLIITKNGVDIARASTQKHEDGSLTFAGNLAEQEEVYFGVGNVKQIVSNPLKVSKVNVESFFIYSCMARRRFIPDYIQEELSSFSDLAPTSGFFTYGEFYTQTNPELLNQTLTAVALSESNHSINVIHKKEDNILAQEKTYSALTNLLSLTTKELKDESDELQELKKELNAQKANMALIQEMAHIGTWELDLESGKITSSKELYKMYNRDSSLEPPTYLEFINMVVEEDREKLLKAQEQLKNDSVQTIEIHVKRADGKILTIIESGKMIFKNGLPFKILGVTLNITDIKMKDNLIMQQSKLAQMGEMINMIAHQWRQPLNAINAAAIKLSMQNDMDLTTSDEISKTTLFIENMAQEMSNTINDFMNFTKPTNEKESIQIATIIEDILRLMGAQLRNHNIDFSTDIEKDSTLLTYKKDLEHVLINLISNARDAFEDQEIENKTIVLKAYSQGDSCFIKIIDNAGGIQADVIERIFEPYFTTKAQGKGTGLGLYMSRKIVKENLNGHLDVENLDNGAEFILTIGKK